jgi:hypothetical protein
MSAHLDRPGDLAIPPDRLAARQKLLEDYIAGAATAPRSSWVPQTRVVRFAVAGAAFSLLFGGTALAYIAFKSPSVPVTEVTRCYTVASLQGDANSPFFGTETGRAQKEDGTRDPATAVQQCATLWRNGMLTAGAHTVGSPDGAGHEHPVPLLQACVLKEGIAAVFPGEDGTCEMLGLPRLR